MQVIFNPGGVFLALLDQADTGIPVWVFYGFMAFCGYIVWRVWLELRKKPKGKKKRPSKKNTSASGKKGRSRRK